MNEELTRGEVRGIVDSCIDDFLKEKEFKKAVNEIVADSLDTFFREMWTKRSVWKNAVKNR